MTRKLRWLLVVSAVALMMTVVASGSAAAAKGHPGSGSSGACAVTPNPVAVGQTYTILGTGFKADELLNVYVGDSHGTQAFMISADSSGAFSVSSYESWAGTSTVKVYDNGGRKLVYLTSCSFQVN